MAIGEGNDLSHRADQLRVTVHALARCSTDFRRPLGSFVLLGTLADAQRTLAQIYEQLAHWHGDVIEGTHYKGDHAERSGPQRAESALRNAAGHAEAAADSIQEAHRASGATQWCDVSE